jgi:hypothetical protein
LKVEIKDLWKLANAKQAELEATQIREDLISRIEWELRKCLKPDVKSTLEIDRSVAQTAGQMRS